MVIGVSCMFFASSIFWFGVAFTMFGVSNATSTVMMPLYSSFYPKKDMEKAMGLYGLINISAVSLGSLSGYIPAYMIARLAFTELSAYRIVMAAASILFILQYVFYIASSNGIEEKLSERFSFKLKSWRPVLKFSALSLMFECCGCHIVLLFPVLCQHKVWDSKRWTWHTLLPQ